MSARHLLSPGPMRPGVAGRRHPLFITAALLAAAPLLFSSSVNADPPAPVQVLDPSVAREGGMTVGLQRREVGGELLVEVDLPAVDGRRGRATDQASRLLDVTAGGAMVAVTDEIDMLQATVTIRQADGTIVARELRGVIAARFSPDATSLYAIDGGGALWAIASATGEGGVIAEGPFSGPIALAPDGALLLRRVSSVEAPFQAQLQRFDPANGATTALTGDELVFSAHVLADGSLLYVAHERGDGGTVIKRLTDDGAIVVADLGTAAIDVDISVDGGRTAFAVAGDGIYVADGFGAVARRIGSGERPRFSPDGNQLLVLDGATASVIGLDGTLRARLATPSSAWVSCDEECAP